MGETPERPDDFRDTTARWEFDRKQGCGDAGHEWQPVSIEFPRTHAGGGTCYVVCLKCGGSSYIETWWVGYKLPNAFDVAVGDA